MTTNFPTSILTIPSVSFQALHFVCSYGSKCIFYFFEIIKKTMISNHSGVPTQRLNCNCNIVSFNYYITNSRNSQPPKIVKKKGKVSLSQSFSRKNKKMDLQKSHDQSLSYKDDEIPEKDADCSLQRYSTAENEQHEENLQVSVHNMRAT